jgi:hypothetical protein
VHTAISLGCRCCFSGLILVSSLMASRTSIHSPILAHIFSHSRYLKKENLSKFS